MKTLFITLAALAILSSPMQAQPLPQPAPKDSSSLLSLAAHALAVSAIDYVGFNMAKRSPEGLKVYRVFQGVFLASTTVSHGLEYGTLEGGKVLLLNWTFTMDFGYYALAYIINPASKYGFENRADVARMMGGGYPLAHAWWTPLAPFNDAFRTPSGLAFQSLVGINLCLHF